MATKKAAPKKKTVDWEEAMKPLLKKYKSKKHPLDYKNIYQLLVGVVLSAQTSDNYINKITPKLFDDYPDMESLSRATPQDLIEKHIKGVIGHRKKADWLVRIAREIKTDNNIPKTMEAFVALPGIGRKSANVIMREQGLQTEGVMVDLHVVRVAQRLGTTKSDKPDQIEKDLMEALSKKQWTDAGMAISFLGRETCRPTDPKHAECVMKTVCAYYASEKTKGKKPVKKKKANKR
jgi:endonuclease III